MPTLTHGFLGRPLAKTKLPLFLISGKTGEGVADLLAAIDSKLVQDPVARQLFRLPLGEGRALNLLHERATVIVNDMKTDHCEVVADAPQSIRNRLAEFAVGQPTNASGESAPV